MTKRIPKKVWVLKTNHRVDTPKFFLSFGKFGPIAVRHMIKARRFKTRAGAESELTHDMKHQGYIATEISVWEAKS